MRKNPNNLLIVLLLVAQAVNGQLSVDDVTYAPEALVKDILVNSPCATIENVVASSGDHTGNRGLGFFDKKDADFPLEKGVILSTGRARNAPGPNQATGFPTLEDGAAESAWLGDRDLERTIGLAPNSTFNATSLEFDFTPTASQIRFRFLMASEEYISDFPCTFSDSFAFLLRPVGSTEPYRNLAVIPGTSTPISVVNIHPAGPACPARNIAFFDKSNTGGNAAISAINFNGQTKVFTASSEVVPGQRYHIKLVIADFQDGAFDSAVFLEAGSFDLGGSLGEDRTIANGNPGCKGSPVNLKVAFDDEASYQWVKDGVDIPGATAATYDVLTDGEYGVKVNLKGTCTSTVDPVTIEFINPPKIEAAPTDLLQCEVDDDGIESFDLSVNTVRALGDQDPVKFSVSYHLSQADADTNTNAIAIPYRNTAPKQTIYLRIADRTQTCFLTDSFQILVQKLPVANKAKDYGLCDADTDGRAVFDLATKTAEILGTQSATDFEVLFYTTEAAASMAMAGSEITGPFTNTANPQEIYARVQHKANTDCFAIASFPLVVHPLPVLKSGIQLQQCDDDTDGISAFNLNEANRLLSDDHANQTFVYYNNRANAESGTDPIADPTAYNNPRPLGASVFARVRTEHGCAEVAEVRLSVSATQLPATFVLPYETCDDALIDGDDTNGVASFDFSDATARIRNLFPAGQQLTIRYYQNQKDALAETNAIPDVTIHRNTASPGEQDIYVRVDSAVENACLGLGVHIKLKVKSLPKTQAIAAYRLCSDTAIQSFDLTTKMDEIIGDQTTPLLISFHKSLEDAENDRNLLLHTYENTENPQTIYVNAHFDDNGNGAKDPGECRSTAMSFQLFVDPNPVLAPATLEACEDSYLSVFDLNGAHSQLVQSGSGVGLTFYASEADFASDRPIANTSAYVLDVPEKTLIVKGTTPRNCTAKTTLTLKTTLYANIAKELDPIEECETDNDGRDTFDLTVRQAQLLKDIDPNAVVITYHEVASDAEMGSSVVQDPKAYTNNVRGGQTLYVRVQQKNSKCYQIVQQQLRVRSVEPIAFEQSYILCLDADERPLAPLPVLDTKRGADQFAFEWFHGESPRTANRIAGATAAALKVDAPGAYWVRAIDKVTGCDIFSKATVTASYAPQKIEIEKTNDTFSGNNSLVVAVTGKGTYEYRLDDGDFQASDTFENVLFGERTITVRDIHGCGTLTKKTIVIDFPKFFSPNGDEINDTWHIVGVSQLENATVQIYNRYGQFMGKITKNSRGWDGNYQGRPLPSSDYWFKIMFTENGTTKTYKGHFALKR